MKAFVAFADLYAELLEGVALHVNQVADRYRIDHRTAQRWLKAINDSLLPLEYDHAVWRRKQ